MEKYLNGVRVTVGDGGFCVTKGDGFGEVCFGLSRKKARMLRDMLTKGLRLRRTSPRTKTWEYREK